MTAGARAAERLAGLYPVERDARIGWLPDEPSAIEAHVRAGGECDLVVGYGGSRLAELDRFATRCLAAPAERNAGGASDPDDGDVWRAWLAAAGPGALDSGAQLGGDLSRLQIYLRGHFAAETVAACATAAGQPVDRRIVANALALFSARDAEMVGLELGAGGAPRAAVYLALPNRSRDDRAALRDLVGFLLDAILPGAGGGAAAMWRDVAGELLVSPVEEWIYVSFDPAGAAAAPSPWVKVDLGQRALALAGRVAAALAVDVSPMLAAAGARGFDPVSHLGIRFATGKSPALSIYAPLS
jgi:hypothetical protein